MGTDSENQNTNQHVVVHPNTQVQIVPADGRYPANVNSLNKSPRPKTLCACWRRCDPRHRRCMPAVFHAAYIYAYTFTFTLKRT
jgi:hypothetical protein